MERLIVRCYYWFSFLLNFPFAFSLATYVLFLQENKLSFKEVGLVNASFMAVVFLMQIPTGTIADIFGRKLSVIGGVFVYGCGFLIYFFSHSLLWFIIAESTLAVGKSFIDGALEAWVKDSLDFNGCNGHNLAATFSKGEIVNKVAFILGGTIGGLVGSYNLRWPWLMSAVGVFLCGIISLRMIREDYFVQGKKHDGMARMMWNSLCYGWKNKAVRHVALFGGFFTLSMQAINMQWSPLFAGSFGKGAVGWIWFGMSVFIAIGAVVAAWLCGRKVAERSILINAVIFVALCVALCSIIPAGALLVPIFFLHEVGRGVFTPVQKAYAQKYIPSDQRAAISSFVAMSTTLGAGIGWPLGGFLADYLSIQNTWLAMLSFAFVALWFGLKLKK